jgi:hypothetical protein
MTDWTKCKHEWVAKTDSQFHSEKFTDVVCPKCECPGEQNNETKEVYWPAT